MQIYIYIKHSWLKKSTMKKNKMLHFRLKKGWFSSQLLQIVKGLYGIVIHHADTLDIRISVIFLQEIHRLWVRRHHDSQCEQQMAQPQPHDPSGMDFHHLGCFKIAPLHQSYETMKKAHLVFATQLTLDKNNQKIGQLFIHCVCDPSSEASRCTTWSTWIPDGKMNKKHLQVKYHGFHSSTTKQLGAPHGTENGSFHFGSLCLLQTLVLCQSVFKKDLEKRSFYSPKTNSTGSKCNESSALPLPSRFGIFCDFYDSCAVCYSSLVHNILFDKWTVLLHHFLCYPEQISFAPLRCFSLKPSKLPQNTGAIPHQQVWFPSK